MVISNLEFRIADTFIDSLGRLTGDEQKAVKTTAFDLQLDPKSPGLQFHRIERAKDKNFWSIRVSRDLRLIVHKTDQSLLLCFVDHHNKAYEWAEKRKLQTHSKTGAAQLVEIGGEIGNWDNELAKWWHSLSQTKYTDHRTRTDVPESPDDPVIPPDPPVEDDVLTVTI